MRELVGIAMTLGLVACSPYTGGVGSASGAMLGDDDATAGEESGASDGGGTTATTGGGGGTGTSGASTTVVDDTADGPAMDEGPGGHANLTISNAPVFDFGPRNLTDNVDQALMVANEGDADATGIVVGGVDGSFSIRSHDCGATLGPGASCQVVVRFDPDLFGDVDTELLVTYQDFDQVMMVSRQIVGRGVGATGNLLINGGGEEGDANIVPMGWTAVSGDDWSSGWNQVTPHEGARTISAGYGPIIVDFALRQQIVVGPLTTWGDASGVRFYYRAFHRTGYEGDDPNRVLLRLRDGGSTQLAEQASATNTTTTWNESVGNFLGPAGTQVVELVLECTRVNGQYCNGFFDGLEVWAEWLG